MFFTYALFKSFAIIFFIFLSFRYRHCAAPPITFKRKTKIIIGKRKWIQWVGRWFFLEPESKMINTFQQEVKICLDANDDRSWRSNGRCLSKLICQTRTLSLQISDFYVRLVTRLTNTAHLIVNLEKNTSTSFLPWRRSKKPINDFPPSR